jgi:glycosyltransferase involved in cell wall biosynthesis
MKTVPKVAGVELGRPASATQQPFAREARTMRVVIAHDFMETYGGAERVTQEMAKAFPEAPVYAILGRPSVAQRMGIAERFQTLLPARPGLLRQYRLGAPVLPLLVDRARLPEADVLLTSSYAFALRFRTANEAPQVCYCHSPLRFAWTMTDSYRAERAPGALSGAAFAALAWAMRRSDGRTSRRVSRFLTQSPFVAEQILRFYGRQSTIIGAPIDCDLFRPDGAPGPGDYFLFCGRLVEPYKRAEAALDAFRDLPHRLVVAGDGPALGRLRAIAPPNVEFVGHLDDPDLVELMQHCRALVFPSRDDFGLLPLEVMSCGRPVLAFAGGGARHTVIPGLTGELFDAQTPTAIAEAVRTFDAGAYDSARIRDHALNWDRSLFQRRLLAAVEEAKG